MNDNNGKDLYIEKLQYINNELDFSIKKINENNKLKGENIELRNQIEGLNKKIDELNSIINQSKNIRDKETK
jgi:hypothetical protein